MTLNDPLQGVLVCRPNTLYFIERTRPIGSHSHKSRTDRLQGIMIAKQHHALVLPEPVDPITPELDMPTVVPLDERVRELDELTIDELESMAVSMLFPSEPQPVPKITRSSHHVLIHDLRIPLRIRND